MVGERVIIYSHKLEDQGTLRSPVDCDQHILCIPTNSGVICETICPIVKALLSDRHETGQ